jgi:predicted nucleic acid-binding protein
MCVTPGGGAVTEPVSPAERAVLDTSVVIADQVGPIPGVLAISAITLAMLNFGVLVATTIEVRAERLRRLSLLQQRFDALPVDEAVSVSYGRLAAAVVDARRRPRRRVMNLLIAATAHAHGARLYTRNARGFAGLEGLAKVIEV